MALWLAPRAMAKQRERNARHGPEAAARFDAVLRGRTYALALRCGLASGVALIAWGLARVIGL